MSNFIDFLDNICSNEDDKNDVVEKTIPLKPAELKAWEGLQKITAELVKIKQKRIRARSAFWGMIEDSTGIYDQDMRISKGAKEVDILAN